MTSEAVISRSDEAPAGAPLYLADTRANFARVPSLDGLRAVSILLVMLSHYVDSRLFPGGLGVLVFFVVSGFLIARLMLAEAKATGRVGFRNFYLRRFFRLYPVIIVYTAAVVLFCAVFRRPLDWYEPASALLYFANYLYAWSSTAGHAGATQMPFGIFWSLSIEEHFYLFFPVLFAFVRGRALVACLTAVCAACLALRIALAHLHPELLGTHVFYYSDLRLDSIAFGVLLAVFCETSQDRRLVAALESPAAVAMALAAIFLCLVIRNDWFRETLRYTILAASVAALLAAVVFSPRYRIAQTVLNWPFVRWIGVLSYSLYVWHTFLPGLLHTLAPKLPRDAGPPAAFALSLGVACLSYYGIERPAAALRHRFGSRTAA